MSRKTANRWFWLTVLSVVGGFAILTWVVFTDTTSAFEIVGWLTGAVLPVLSYIYNQIQKRSIAVFLFGHRIRSFFSPHPLAWNLTATLFARELTPTIIDDIVSKLSESNGKDGRIRIRQVSSYNVLVELPSGPNLDILYSPVIHTVESNVDDSSRPYVQVFINNYRVGYRQASHALRREIIPLLNRVTNVVHAIDTQYKLVVDFDKQDNPYFSLYVAQLPPQAIANFLVRLNINVYEPGSTVMVSEARMSINTRSSNALENLALDLLAFDSNLQEYLRHA